MPKAWSTREKEVIRKNLLNEGKKLFEKYGLQKTTVSDIVNATKISKGSFYLFYQSKEELYFDVLEETEREFRDKLFKENLNPEKNRRKAFKSFLNQLIKLLTTMPLYKQINASNYELLLRKLPEDKLKDHVQHDQEDISKYFIYWMDNGWMRKVDIDALNGLFLSLIHFVIHRDDLKGASFEASKDLWIDAITSYLIIEEDGE
ncbi:TetR/AcrR family transcriptional regulator [Methanobacterium alcaliphilum]|uniref:TetR/AcrR family transcriptional regulator n=1 Tax=Methanobacterium alcaliphilum TaxID=392018 RepID=UPI00200A8E8B|nr:TetR/AcrR family transcriptional regulator [Methanobacterium alcaliphilum]MCK9151389.1 TetR/AcrR family transcriptional regulator [Methanobacterium alcaliphilum]